MMSTKIVNFSWLEGQWRVLRCFRSPAASRAAGGDRNGRGYDDPELGHPCDAGKTIEVFANCVSPIYALGVSGRREWRDARHRRYAWRVVCRQQSLTHWDSGHPPHSGVNSRTMSSHVA